MMLVGEDIFLIVIGSIWVVVVTFKRYFCIYFLGGV